MPINSENRQAYKDMYQQYDPNIVGQIMGGILEHHKKTNVLYTLNEEAESVFEVITDKLERSVQFEVYIGFSDLSIAT